MAFWDIETGREVDRFDCSGSVAALQYSADGTRLLIITSRNKALVLDVDNLNVVAEIQAEDHRFSRGFFADGGKRVITYRTEDGKLCCWNAESGDLIHSLDSPDGRISLDLNKQGTQAVLAGRDSGCARWGESGGAIG